MTNDDAPIEIRRKYTDDVTYNINGKLLNSFCQYVVTLEDELADYKQDVLVTELADLRARDKNPTLKNAWDAYQTVLGLTNK